MAEAAGLVIGVIALAGLFNNTVKCFEFVQLDRTFGKNFQTSQLKLDSARLRLSRWSKSLNLDVNVRNTTLLQGLSGSKSTVKHAKGLLAQILKLFPVRQISFVQFLMASYLFDDRAVDILESGGGM